MSGLDQSIEKRKHRRYTPRYPSGNPIWRYFSIPVHSTIPQCNACQVIIMNGWKSIAGNTTNMRNHLKNKHPHLFQELCLICEKEQKRHNPTNWSVVPYISKDQFLEEIIPKPEAEPESQPPSHYTTPQRPSAPPSAHTTPVNTTPQTESTVPSNPRSLKEELEAEEALLRLELLRSKIRREVAATEFYRAQTRAIKEGRFSSVVLPPS